MLLWCMLEELISRLQFAAYEASVAFHASGASPRAACSPFMRLRRSAAAGAILGRAGAAHFGPLFAGVRA